jgi:hypothetical protein
VHVDAELLERSLAGVRERVDGAALEDSLRLCVDSAHAWEASETRAHQAYARSG